MGLPKEMEKKKKKERDDLILKRKGGGSVIDYRPLFSADGETLFIIMRNFVRAFSTKTGDFVQEFEKAENRIIGISLCLKFTNTVVGCTESGTILFWHAQTGLINRTLDLEMKPESAKLKTFHIVHCDAQETNFLITYCCEKEGQKMIKLETYNIFSGYSLNNLSIDTIHDQYFVDIIGNHEENLIAIAHGINIHIVKPSTMVKARNLLTRMKVTCVAGHPVEEWLATGDTSGRVTVWRGFSDQKNAAKSTYHWHTLPVTEIVFSVSGTSMYTGGGESVLVKWNLSNQNERSFLPRLSAPIKYLTIAAENTYVAVSTLDNGITMTDPQRKLTALIQNFTWGVTKSTTALFPAGLLVDPRTKNLVLNSRTGHIQFYNTKTKTLTYNVNITGQNLMSQERNTVIVNTDVTKIALNFNGMWLATVEERDDQVSSMEIRLKFWKFDTQSQIYSLNTSIELPHDVGVNALQFQRNHLLDEDSDFAVTTGKDKKFKLWNLVTSTSIYKKTKHWQCHSVGYYRNLEPSDASFSEDGSILGVAFDSTLTLWNPETMELKKTLSYFTYKEKLVRIEFGKFETRHLVLVASSAHIAVWDLLTLRIKWSVPLKFSTLASDSLSSYMAVFTTENTLFVFKPSNPTPIYTRKNIIENNSSIICACFMPHPQEIKNSMSNSWQKKSQLYFLDSNQELMTLEPETKSEAMLSSLVANDLHVTAFSRMLAPHTVSGNNEVAPIFHEHLGVTGKGIEDEILSIPAHMLPNLTTLCTPFMLFHIGK